MFYSARVNTLRMAEKENLNAYKRRAAIKKESCSNATLFSLFSILLFSWFFGIKISSRQRIIQ